MNKALKIVSNGAELDPAADPGYKAAAEKLAELKAQAADRDRRGSQLEEGLSQDLADELTQRAQRLLAAGHPGEARAVVEQRLENDLTRIREEARVLKRAIELQERIVGQELTRVSREICDRLRPAHRALIAHLARAMQEFVEATKAERLFRERLISAGVVFAGTLRPMPPPHASAYDGDGSYETMASAWLKEAREEGLL